MANYLNQHPEENLSSLAEKKENAISRKEFNSKMGKIGLYTATIGGIPLLTNCNDNNGKTGKSANKGAVIAIIGGGISGLNCAYQFMINGFDATILHEGSFRVGGRVLTHYGDALENGVHPEFGGMFIDTAHEEMHRLVKEFGLETLNLLEESNEKGLVYVTFHFGKDPVEYIKITMKEVLVASVSVGGSGGEDRLTENVTLNFAEFKFEYQPQSAKGGKEGAAKIAAWDIAGNAAACPSLHRCIPGSPPGMHPIALRFIGSLALPVRFGARASCCLQPDNRELRAALASRFTERLASWFCATCF